MNAASKKLSLCQYFTPAATARFMAELFPPASGQLRLLDAGAGLGALSSALLERFATSLTTIDCIHIHAFELDETQHQALKTTIQRRTGVVPVSLKIKGGDFVEAAVNTLLSGEGTTFTHAILNPPYMKIPSASSTRQLLRRVGIETSNFYSAFVALAVLLTENGGQVVAIIPRSFCNGQYHRKFRQFLLERTAIQHIHLFETRDRIFRKDSVLQEMVVIRLERGAAQGPVAISTSIDGDCDDIIANHHEFQSIVRVDDPERVFHFPRGAGNLPSGYHLDLSCTLSDLGINVSTGPIMEFRLRDHLRSKREASTVPLIFPCHCRNGQIIWPSLDSRRSNAIKLNNHTLKYMYPNGWYCVARRISSNEEARRLVATVVDPAIFRGADWVGIENHLNLFHANGRGLPQATARGLATFLNSTVADSQFRQFSGSTQVNASDLKRLRYPDIQTLKGLGENPMPW